MPGLDPGTSIGRQEVAGSSPAMTGLSSPAMTVLSSPAMTGLVGDDGVTPAAENVDRHCEPLLRRRNPGEAREAFAVFPWIASSLRSSQ
jgi:hypothetical protein